MSFFGTLPAISVLYARREHILVSDADHGKNTFLLALKSEQTMLNFTNVQLPKE
jgi:hypothetical protein